MDNFQEKYNFKENNLNVYDNYNNSSNCCDYKTFRSSLHYNKYIKNNESSLTDRNNNLHKLKTYSTEEATNNSRYRNKNYKKKKLSYCKSTDNINDIRGIFNKKQKILKDLLKEDNSQKNYKKNINIPIKIIPNESHLISDINKKKKTISCDLDNNKIVNYTLINNNNKNNKENKNEFNKTYENIKVNESKINKIKGLNLYCKYNENSKYINGKENFDYTNIYNINYNDYNNIFNEKWMPDLNYNYSQSEMNKDINYKEKNDDSNLLYFTSFENRIKNKKKKYDYHKIINNKKEKIKNKIEKTIINNSTNNNFITESQKTRLIFENKNNTDYISSNNNDSIKFENHTLKEINDNPFYNELDKEIIKKMKDKDFYEKNCKYLKNKNSEEQKIEKTIFLKISRFEFIIQGYSNEIKMSNYENEKLIKIYEKEIQRLNKKLNEANIKIKEYMKLMINSQSEIYILKEKLNMAKKELNASKIEDKIIKRNIDDNSSILGRNKNSFIIKLPESFMTFKSNNEENQINSNKLGRNSSMIYKNKKENKNITIKKNNNKKLEIYTKKISKKLTRSNSQPNVNEFELNNLNKIKNINDINYINSQRIINKNNCNKLIYIIYPYEKFKKILCFDIDNKQFSKISYLDKGDFNKNYLDSFRSEESEYNSIFLMHKNNLYIVTGINSDLLYIYNPQKNIMNKICKLKNNHSNGVLINFQNKLFCLSGKFNKKVEIFSDINKEWVEINEMNIERSFFSSCIFKNRYIFCLFGYNTPTNKYLDTIEFYDIKNEDKGWKYLNYKNPNLLRMNICGFISINFKNEKIIIFGGINGIEQNPVTNFYQIILNKDFENYSFIEEIKRTPKDIYKNKYYYFSNGISSFEEENKIICYTGFDNNYNAHIIRLNNELEHDIFYFAK